MSDTPPRPNSGGFNVFLGVFRVARGRADGIPLFGSTPQAFLASLAPLVAFPLVGALLMLTRGGGLRSLADLFATVCALLTPPVLSWQFARLWHREGAWLRFATAFNWCQWVLPVVALLILVLLSVGMALGLPDRSGRVGVVLGLGLYGLWLHWFLARHALSLSGGRAALLVLGVNMGTVMVVLAPRLLLGVGRE
ncbi:MAG: hypothetical protein AB7F35_18360 [Acetobacteraceae bacterium]